MTTSYDSVYRASQENPQAFWAEAAKLVHWYKEPTIILDDSKPPFLQWFADG
jgi:propionyl-CoA synthetase